MCLCAGNLLPFSAFSVFLCKYQWTCSIYIWTSWSWEVFSKLNDSMILRIFVADWQVIPGEKCVLQCFHFKPLWQAKLSSLFTPARICLFTHSWNALGPPCTRLLHIRLVSLVGCNTAFQGKGHALVLKALKASWTNHQKF